MLSIVALQNTIYDWVDGQAVVNANSISWEFQNAAKADKPSFSLRILSMGQIGDSVVANATSGNTDERNILTTYDFTLEILGFGTGIFEKTIQLKTSLNLPDIHKQLADGGVISWNNTERVLDISGLDGDENEERSSYDAFMRTLDTVENVSVGQISIVNGVGTLKQPGKPDTILNFNIDTTI